jgi:hypothetical protein
MTEIKNTSYGSLSMCSSAFLVSILFCLTGCKSDDPKPVNEEELVTTFEVTLLPQGNGIPVRLKFFDADGEHGNIAPLVSVSGSLKASTLYSGEIMITNETVFPPADISAEVAAEAGDHLFCYDVAGNITIGYKDEDSNGLALGLKTSWQTGASGAATVTISLRHQPGVKTGVCPGGGDTDAEVSFDVLIE